VTLTSAAVIALARSEASIAATVGDFGEQRRSPKRRVAAELTCEFLERCVSGVDSDRRLNAGCVG